mgnify:CR=1 FL=1
MTYAPAMSRPARVLLMLALVLRLVVVWATSDVELVLDELDYVKRARFILENGHLPDAFRPPVYPAMLAAIFGLAGVEPTAVRLAQALLGTGTAALLYHWLEGHVGERGALVSLGVFAVYPTIVGFTHFLFTETVYLGALVVALWLLVPGEPVRSDNRPVAAGLVLGLAGLTRSLMVPLLPVVGLAVGVLHRSWRPGARFIATAGVVLLPWMAHNLVVTGTPTVLEISNGYNLWKGNTPVEHPMATQGPRFPGPIVSIPMFPYEGSKGTLEQLCKERSATGDVLAFAELNDCARALAIEHIVDDPIAFVGRAPEKIGHTLHPSSQLTRSLWLGSYGSVPVWLGRLLIWSTASSWVLVAGLGLIGWTRMPRGGPKWALLLLVGHQLAVVAVTFGHNRFRLPLVLAAIVAMAWLPRRPAEGA